MSPLIELRHVTKSFGAQTILRDVTLPVRRGETLVIIGESGCGKSVTMKLMMDLLRPSSGTVLWDGRPVHDRSDKEIARERLRFGYVFQMAALFDSMTVYENVAFGLRQNTRTPEPRIRQIVEDRLRDVGLNAGVCHKKPAELSGGMRKRVGLARAIVGRPEILLYDEPVTGLDPVNTAAVSRLILEIRERTHVTSIVVTHDIEQALEISDRVALLTQGKLRFVGPPAAFRASDDTVVRAFADRQAAAEAALQLVERGDEDQQTEEES
jgi:phospholipid/cholesterol/gamma-HCH transport system ATP-binding protein